MRVKSKKKNRKSYDFKRKKCIEKKLYERLQKSIAESPYLTTAYILTGIMCFVRGYGKIPRILALS